MNNEFHQAYTVSSNFPLHIASPDSVRAHLRDEVRLICMLPSEFPKIRGLDILERTIVMETMYAGDVKLQRVITVRGGENVEGFLANDKYYFSRDMFASIPSIQLLFKSFKDNNYKPMLKRDWSWDYISSNPLWYTVVDSNATEFSNQDKYFDIKNYALHGIDCLADLLAQSYKFTWDNEESEFIAFLDPFVITQRIRKPWLSHLVQTEYGESPQLIADDHKLISFLIQKVSPLMTHDERNAVSTYMENAVGLEMLTRINGRNAILCKIISAYNNPTLLEMGPEGGALDPLLNYLDYRQSRGGHGANA